MQHTQPPLQETEAALVRECVEKILGCRLFSQAEHQQKFLHYLAEQTLTGQGHRLKGYSIGAAVFDRNDDFDPRLDAIVRVEATRLRSKLREYYEDVGRLDEVRIELPKGCYELKFSFQTGACRSEQAVSPSALGIDAETSILMPAISVPSDKPSLAVLPFANLGRDPDQDYFADGMTDDLITSLSKLSGLLVIGRQSVFVYKGSNKDAREIARELGVRYLLEGSVRRLEHRVRINAQLVEAAHGLQVWAERYDRDLEGIFALQDDVTRRIVEALEVHLSEAESKTFIRADKVNVEAHDLLLCGRERFWEFTIESAEAAQELFIKALEVDPNYATAHALLARLTFINSPRFSLIDPNCANWDSITRERQSTSTRDCLLDTQPWGGPIFGAAKASKPWSPRATGCKWTPTMPTDMHSLPLFSPTLGEVTKARTACKQRCASILIRPRSISLRSVSAGSSRPATKRLPPPSKRDLMSRRALPPTRRS